MLQQDEPDDYVIATGEEHSVRSSSRSRSSHVGLDQEKHVVHRPALPAAGRGRPPASATRRRPGASSAGRRRTSFRELVELMVDADLERVANDLRGRGTRCRSRAQASSSSKDIQELCGRQSFSASFRRSISTSATAVRPRGGRSGRERYEAGVDLILTPYRGRPIAAPWGEQSRIPANARVSSSRAPCASPLGCAAIPISAGSRRTRRSHWASAPRAS